MATCPFAIDLIGTVPGTNFSSGPVAKIGIVGHVIVGSALGAVHEFQTSGMQLSATYVIAGPNDGWSDGTLLQMLDNQDICYAQANGNWPPTSYNAVEIAGTVDVPMTPAQLGTFRRVVTWDAANLGYPVTNHLVPHGTPGVTVHCNPADGSPDPAWGNHSCPGTLRLQQFSQLLSGGGPPVTPFGINPPVQPSAAIVDWHLTGAYPAGALLLGEDGSVYALGSAQFFGGANGQPYFAGRQAAHFGALTLQQVTAGKKYVIVDLQGETYAFPQ